MNHSSNSSLSVTHDGEMFQGTARLYLDLMKRCLTNSLNGDRETQVVRSNGLRTTLLNTVLKPDWHIVEKRPYDPEERANGRDWPSNAETMIGANEARQSPVLHRRHTPRERPRRFD